MTVINAQARLYQGSYASVVDEILDPTTISCNFSLVGNITRQVTFTANIDAEVNAAATAKLATFGGKMTANLLSSLTCKFPTYVRIDVDKLGLAEGVDVVLQLEEGFVIEGDYAESLHKPMAKNNNLITFRTPKHFYNQTLASQFTTVATMGFRKFASSSLSSNATMVPRITYNPGRFASLEMSYFINSISARKTVSPSSVMSSQFTFPIGNFRARLADSTFVQDPFTLAQPSEQARVRFGQSPMSNQVIQQTEGTKFKGMIDTFITMSSQVTSATTTATATVNVTSAFTPTMNIKITRNYGIDMYSTASLSLPSIRNYPFVYSHSITPSLITNSPQMKSDGNYVLFHGIQNGYSRIDDPGAMYVYDKNGNLNASRSTAPGVSESNIAGFGYAADFNNGRIVTGYYSYPTYYPNIDVYDTTLTRIKNTNLLNAYGSGVANNIGYNYGPGNLISSSGTTLSSGDESYNNGSNVYSSGIIVKIPLSGTTTVIRHPNVNTIGENQFRPNYASKNKWLNSSYNSTTDRIDILIYDKDGTALSTQVAPQRTYYNGYVGNLGVSAMSDSHILYGSGGWYTFTPGGMTDTTPNRFHLYTIGGTYVRDIAFPVSSIDNAVQANFIDNDYVYLTVRNRLEIIRISDGVTIQRYTDPDGVPYILGVHTFTSGETIMYARVGSTIKAYIRNF